MTGTKKIDTRSRQIDPSKSQAFFNEKFQMKTALDYDVLRHQFIKKKVQRSLILLMFQSNLQVWKKDMSQMLGEADFDLSKYANEERAMEDRLPIKNSSDPNAFIEIYIKAKVLEAAPQTSSRVASALNISMPVIEERDSEFDVKEELEKKEKEYKRNIERLEEHLDQLKRLNDEKSNEMDTMNQTQIGVSPDDILDIREKDISQLE